MSCRYEYVPRRRGRRTFRNVSSDCRDGNNSRNTAHKLRARARAARYYAPASSPSRPPPHGPSRAHPLASMRINLQPSATFLRATTKAVPRTGSTDLRRIRERCTRVSFPCVIPQILKRNLVRRQTLPANVGSNGDVEWD